MPNSLVSLIAFVAAALVAAGLTKIHLRWSGRLAHFASPDAFHGTPAALSGGVGIWIAFLGVTALAGGTATPNWLIIGPSLAMFAVGLWDDLRPLAPQKKLLLQIFVSTGGVALGLQFDTPGLEVFGVPLSILWLVSLVNAFNLIDNMDGLAPGVAALAGIFLSVHAWSQGSYGVAVAAAAFAGAHAGFLPFNFKPARIFLGDCGSMAAGFFLSAASMAGTWRDVSNVLFVILVPALIFAVPIFNMVFVIITRNLSGVPVSRGRADHISYRLVAYGLSERKSVIFIYILSAACGVLALGYSRLGNVTLMALAGVVTMAFLYLGIFLYEASVRGFYSDFGVEQQGSLDLTKLPFAQYWWRLFQLLGDFILISVGYYLAYLMRFEGSLPAAQERNFIVTLPYFILVKTVIFAQFRLYGSYWRYVGINDLLKILQAVGLSTLVLVTGTAFVRLEFFSRSVLAIDAIVTVLLIGGSRVLLRVLREFILGGRSTDTLVRTIIVGAGESGQLMLRAAQHNAKLGLNVVGFLDDDTSKVKATIHGVRVLGPTGALPEICREKRPQLAIVAMPSAPPERIGEIAALCREAGVQCKLLSFKLADYVPSASGDGTRP